jgi:hypothetical protein
MSLLDEMLADIPEIESDMNSPSFMVTWIAATKSAVNQGPYSCIPSSNREERILGEGGFYVNYDLVLSAQLSQFDTSIPTDQDKILYNDKTYRIVRTHTQPIVGSYIRLFCEDATRGV